MKFNLKYPDMKPVHDERDGIIYGMKEQPCQTCKELTRFVEINYQAHYCSEECVQQMDNEYNRWLNEPS